MAASERYALSCLAFFACRPELNALTTSFEELSSFGGSKRFFNRSEMASFSASGSVSATEPDESVFSNPPASPEPSA